MSRPIISLTTDFGLADAYVGVMKGVILGICPEAALVDISHTIAPQSIQQAAFVLSTAVPYFPVGTVHLVVVDPGVGSDRRPIAVRTERAFFVAPDNGVLGLALAPDPPRQVVRLSNQAYRLPSVSATFHGRDIFAPAAAHLACGLDLLRLGEPIPPADLVALPHAEPQREGEGIWRGLVLHVDHFGNLITNFRAEHLPPGPLRLAVGAETIAGLHQTFADVAPGDLVAYLGSSGYVEIAERNGNAARRLAAGVGSPVYISQRR